MTQFTTISFQKVLLEVFEESGTSDFLLLNNWSSIEKLLVVGAIYNHFEVLLTHNDIKEVGNTTELFELIKSKLLN